MKNLLRLAIRDMIGLTDTQLKIVMNAARLLPVEKRDIFLQRIAAMLAVRGRGRFTDTDVADVAQLAMAAPRSGIKGRLSRASLPAAR
jgi:hypothetical protein